VFNVGDGPIEVRGRARKGDEMTRIRQWIYRSDGTSRGVLKPDAEIFYARDGHDHFHVARFIVVRLRPNPGTVASDCGWQQSCRVTLGVSVGWGDYYPPEFTFQSIDASGLPQGSYRICATVNPKGIWTEKNNNFANNSYWMDLDLNVASNQLTVTGTGETACW